MADCSGATVERLAGKDGGAAEGFFIEASINYPVELLEAHNDYTLTPGRVDVQVKMLSKIQVELRTHFKMSRTAHSKKLIPNLLPKSN